MSIILLGTPRCSQFRELKSFGEFGRGLSDEGRHRAFFVTLVYAMNSIDCYLLFTYRG